MVHFGKRAEISPAPRPSDGFVLPDEGHTVPDEFDENEEDVGEAVFKAAVIAGVICVALIFAAVGVYVLGESGSPEIAALASR